MMFTSSDDWRCRDNIEQRGYLWRIGSIHRESNTMTSRLTHLIILAILAFSMSGCSIGGRYYVRNFTAATAAIILTFAEPGATIDQALSFRLSREIKAIRRNLHKDLDDVILGKYLTATDLEIEIPPNSTVFVAIGSNMRMWGIETITIASQNGSQVINSDDTEKLNVRMRGIGQYTGHFDIK